MKKLFVSTACLKGDKNYNRVLDTYIGAGIKNIELSGTKYSSENIINRYYLRIITEDKPGVLASITNLFNETGISVEKILQLPEKINVTNLIPIIITTHKIQKETLTKVINKIEKIKFVKEKITVLPIHDN